jgi:hypothetical protein
MYFKKTYWIGLFFVFLGALTWSVMELASVWNGEYKTYNSSQGYHANLIYSKYREVKDLMQARFFGGAKQGLPTVRLYVSEKSKSNLMENLPANIKKWQKGLLVYPDNRIRKIKIRFRGDNPFNWLSAKKSWRIKTKKNQLINRVRTWNLINIVDNNYISQYLSYIIHQRMGLPTQKIRLIELFINDLSQGVYIEIEHLDENFLRNNGFMPVNLYKGEQVWTEKTIGRADDLFDNPSLWTKLTVFNQTPDADFSDMKRFLITLKEAETSPEALERLTNIARIDDWAKFSTYQTLVQTWHNDHRHNMRLISDPWMGTIIPLSHDTGMGFPPPENILIDHCTHALTCLYNQYSRFLIAKHRMLKKYIDEGLLQKITLETTPILPLLQTSLKRDLGVSMPRIGTTSLAGKDSSNLNDLQIIHTTIMDRMNGLENFLRESIYSDPSATWQVDGNRLLLTVSGFAPVGNVTLNFGNVKMPNMVFWDADGDNKISESDIRVPTTRIGQKLLINAIFYANRNASIKLAFLHSTKYEGRTFPTTFRLLADTTLTGITIHASNALTHNSVSLPKSNHYGSTPNIFNQPIIAKDIEKTIILSGELVIKEAKVFDQPVVIRAGTTFRMNPFTSLVFRNHLVVEGTPDSPVRVIPVNETQNWGVFALYGEKTNSSKISNLHMSRGTGQTIDGVRYIAMFSIHGAKNIQIEGLKLSDNKDFDDMMHVLYSNNIQIRNSILSRPFSDGIDVDISSVSIDSVKIDEAGNDAVDQMTSTVVLKNVDLRNSKDKGLSVGEDSTAIIINSILSENKIGVEAKDGSNAYIVNSNLINNDLQLSVYAKNWRYGSGGHIVVDKSILHDDDNALQSEKKSFIEIYDSSVRPLPKELGKNIQMEIEVESCHKSTSSRTACRPTFNPSVKKMLGGYERLTDPSVRGAISDS